MRLRNLENEDIEKYTLDVKNTLIANLPNFLWLSLMAIFISESIKFVSTIETSNQIVALIVIIFALLKMSTMFSLVIQYKRRYPIIEGKGGKKK